MRILVVGGYGLIGGAVTARLLADGHELAGVGRRIEAAARRFPTVRWSRGDVARLTAETWMPLLAGIDAVVNCAGALQDTFVDDLRALHVDGLASLAAAVQRAGTQRLVHISAVGTDGTDSDAFGRTKRDGEAALRASGAPWITLRPGFVLAPAAFGGSALLRGLAAVPLAIPAVHADSPVQVVAVDDLAEAVAIALRPDTPVRLEADLVADEATTLRDILLALRGWLGLPRAPIVPVPLLMVRATAVFADALAWLGWRSPMRSTAVAQLARGVRGDAASAHRLPGLRVRGLAEVLAAAPSGVQERWFAKLYFVKPLGLIVLSVFWLASGLIGLFQMPRAAALLAGSGLTPAAAVTIAWAGAITDILLGSLVAVRRFASAALLGMLATSAAYLLGATIWRPELWADPLGSMVKVVPAAILCMAMLAILDER